MSKIKSSTSEASSASGQLKSEAFQLSGVGAAGNVNVPVNQECIDTYTGGQGIFPRYQSLMERDANYINKHATALENLDQSLASGMKK